MLSLHITLSIYLETDITKCWRRTSCPERFSLGTEWQLFDFITKGRKLLCLLLDDLQVAAVIRFSFRVHSDGFHDALNTFIGEKKYHNYCEHYYNEFKLTANF